MKIIIKNHDGFSLIEVLVSVGLMGIVGLVLMTIQTNMFNSAAQNKFLITRSTIRNNIERYISDVSVIKSSSHYRVGNSDGNEILDYCLNGPPAAPTPLCTAADYPNCCVRSAAPNPQSFYIIDPADSAGTRKFSGTTATATPVFAATNTADPIYYSIDGTSCTTPSEVCPLQLATWYLTDCPAAAARCQRASQVLIRYDLHQAPGAYKFISFKNSTNTVQISSAVAAAGGAITWAGYTAVTLGNYGGTAGAHALCDAAFPGSRWASYDEIQQLGAGYPHSQIGWIRGALISCSDDNEICRSKEMTVFTANPTGSGMANYQYSCFLGTSNSVAYYGAIMDTAGRLSAVQCSIPTSLACVK